MRLINGDAAKDETRARQLREVDEAALLEHAHNGDVDAFGQLVDAHLGEVFRLSLMMLNHRSRAEDVSQETFIAAWSNIPYVGTPEQLRLWLFRYCISRCLNLDRTPRRGTNAVALAGVCSAQTQKFASLMQRLNPRQRACWLLREIHGFSDRQIALILPTVETSVPDGVARQWPIIGPGPGPGTKAMIR